MILIAIIIIAISQICRCGLTAMRICLIKGFDNGYHGDNGRRDILLP